MMLYSGRPIQKDTENKRDTIVKCCGIKRCVGGAKKKQLPMLPTTGLLKNQSNYKTTTLFTNEKQQV